MRSTLWGLAAALLLPVPACSVFGTNDELSHAAAWDSSSFVPKTLQAGTGSSSAAARPQRVDRMEVLRNLPLHAAVPSPHLVQLPSVGCWSRFSTIGPSIGVESVASTRSRSEERR